jgi:hypothetical protein
MRSLLYSLWMSAALAVITAPSVAAQADRSHVAALCGDGSYSRARTAQAACSHHGDVAIWYGGTAKTRSEGVATRPNRAPQRSTAQCNDGTFSFVKRRASLFDRRSQACQEHEGVKAWFK